MPRRDFKPGDPVKAVLFGKPVTGEVTRVGNGLVWVQWQGKRHETWAHPESLTLRHAKNPRGRSETLEPNWNGMGEWALNGLSWHVESGGVLRTKNAKDKAARRSLIALLSVAASAAYYVGDIAADLNERLGTSVGLNRAKRPFAVPHELTEAAKEFITGRRGTPDRWTDLLAYIDECEGGWGAISNALSDALEQVP